MAEILFHRGDRVEFRFAVQNVQGVITEDRGPIGIGGRRLYGVKFQFGLEVEEPTYIELPAVKLRRVESVVATG